MILVETDGGLGNQMFQYALGYILSKKLSEPLIGKENIFYDKSQEKFIKFFPNAICQLASQKQIDLLVIQKYQTGVKLIAKLLCYQCN